MLLRQMREEYSHHTFMGRLVEEHGGVLPEVLPEIEASRVAVLPFVDSDWITFLVGFSITIDGIYGYPWSRAVMTATIRDEKYFKFYDAVLFPQEIGHYNFALTSLRSLINDDPGVLDQVVRIARESYPVYAQFIEGSFSYLEGVGADTSQILPKMEQIRNTYWPKEFGVALDENTATPDSDVEYGPGM